MDMAWPLVSWIMSSSSSSSSSSEYDNDGDDNDSDYNEAESPNDDISCNDDDAAAVDSVSPSTQSPCQPLTVAAVDDTDPSSSTSKRRRTDDDEAVKIRATSKRVWTKEDELELLHGFLEHKKRQRIELNNNRRPRQKENHVSSFYNEAKPELQQRFNKSQIVEKLRRLRRKYNQNVANYRKINLSLDNTDQFCFKNSHDKTTFEISHEIWNVGGAEDQTVVDDNVVPQRTRSQTRSEWLRNTKRVLEISDEGSTDTTGLIMGLALNYPIGLMKFGDGDHHDQVVINNDVKDEKWREQQIMELEVYLKRLELVQAQVKAALDKLRSPGG